MSQGQRPHIEIRGATAYIAELKTLGEILNECAPGSRWRDFTGRLWSRRGLLRQWNVHRPCVFVAGQVRPVDVDGSVTGVRGGIIAAQSAQAVLVHIPSDCRYPGKHPTACGCGVERRAHWFILEHRGQRLTALVIPNATGWELRLDGRRTDGITYSSVQDALQGAERELKRIALTV